MRKFNNYIKADSLYHNPYYGKEWGQSNHKIYIDGEYQTFSRYFRNEGNYHVDIIPKYIEKSDMLVWEVSFYPLTGDLSFPKNVEAFETFYDAMDFVDSGELADRIGITASRKFTKYPSNYIKSTTEISDQEFDRLVNEYKGTGAGWSLIVAELKADYGLDVAKDIADVVCTGKKSSKYTSSNPFVVDLSRGPYYIWEEFGTFKGSVNNPDAFITDARKVVTFDGFDTIEEVVEYVNKYF